MNILYKWNAQCALRISLKELKIQMIINLACHSTFQTCSPPDRFIQQTQFTKDSEIRIYRLDFKSQDNPWGSGVDIFFPQLLLRKGKMTSLGSTLCSQRWKGSCFK